jgi:hypothetical protein
MLRSGLLRCDAPRVEVVHLGVVLDLFHLNLLDLCQEQIHLFSTTVAMRAVRLGVVVSWI